MTLYSQALPKMDAFRTCLRDPIPEIAEVARYLDEAVAAHLNKNFALADELIRRANMPAIREWVESIWGKNTGLLPKREPTESIQKQLRIKQRMPTLAQKLELLRRDGYHCRFCGIPVIRTEVRKRIHDAYP